MSKSREHHWWPVALQSYWSTLGDVRWLTSTGEVHSKKYYNEKIAKKSHGHTIILDQELWRLNFEDEFRAADEAIHRVAKGCMRLFSLSRFFKVLVRTARQRLKRRTGIEDFSEYITLDPKFRVELINLCLSLLIRSPANRYKLERTGASFGLPANEELGKINMKTQVDGLQRHFTAGFTGNVFPLIIYSERTEFIYGDGLLDGMSSSFGNSVLRGHALIPLTPHICVLLATPFAVRGNREARTLFAPSWLVEQINEITQVYSRSLVFYASRKPHIYDHFSRNEHLSYKGHMNETVRSLVDLCGEPAQRRLFL